MIKPESPDDVINLITAYADNTLVFPSTEDHPARVLFNPADTSNLFVVTITGPYRTDHPADWADLALDLGLGLSEAADLSVAAERQALGKGGAAEEQPTRGQATMHSPIYSMCAACHGRKEETPDATGTGDVGGSG